MHEVNLVADESESELRISIDAKAVVKVGLFSRMGKSRIPNITGYDHDYAPDFKLTPFGILLPQYNDMYMYFSTSSATSDFIVDALEDWWKTVCKKFKKVKTLVINLDNGPDCNSRRTQFMNRLLEFAHRSKLRIRLAYYPPYHSKYNPIERCWGILENHWNGSILDSVETTLNFAKTMTWKGRNPTVTLFDKIYEKGKRLTQKAMAKIEEQLERHNGLGKWFVDIPNSAIPVTEV